MTPSPPRPTPSRDGVEGLKTTPSPVPGVYTGTGTESGRGAERGTTPSPSGPEHFAAVADRHFVRLREIQMRNPTPAPGEALHHHDPLPPGHLIHDITGNCCDRGAALAMETLPSAADHYRQACHELARADADRGHLPERAGWIDAARTHLIAADIALKIWPHRLVELQAVAAAARDLISSGPDTTDRAEAYDRLTAAVVTLEAGA